MGEGAESEGTVIRTGVELVDSSAKPWTTRSERMNQKEIAMKKSGQGPRSKAKRNPPRSMHQGHAKLTIDKEIAALIPSLSPEELAQLERSIVAEGCREPLSVWEDGQRSILLDGHNRYRICGRHGVAYEIRLVQLADRDAAIRWVAENQLGRRNLTPEAQSYLRGTLYNNTKRQGSRSDLTSGQSAQKLTTAQQLAERHQVDEKTIRRDAYFAEKLDALARADRPDIKEQVLTRGARISRADVPRLLKLDEEARVRILAEVRGGAKASALLRDLGRRGDGRGDHERRVQNNEEAPVAGGAGMSSDTEGSLAMPSGTTSIRPSSRKTNHVIGERNSALEHLEIAAGILRSLSPGSVSSEALEHLDAQVQAIKEELERHRQAVAQPADGPRVDVLAAAQAVFELESEGILSSSMTILDPLFADPNDPQALQRQLAEVRRMIARRARSLPRSSKRRRLIMPANNILDPRGERLLSFKIFNTIQRCLARQSPSMERIYNQYSESRSDSPEHARVCEKIERFIENGGDEIVDEHFSYIHYLKMHCTDAEVYREAARAAEREMTAYLRAVNQLSDKLLVHMRQTTMNLPRSAASHQGHASTKPRRQPAPAAPMATALAGPIRQYVPAPALSPVRDEHTVQPPTPTAASIAAQRERSREHPTSEEVEREVTRIADDLRSGRLRRPFMGEHEIWQKSWPAYVRDEAVKLLRETLKTASGSSDAGPLYQKDDSAPASSPDAAPSIPSHEDSRGLSKPGMSDFAMTEAMARVMPSATLAQAARVAWAYGNG